MLEATDDADDDVQINGFCLKERKSNEHIDVCYFLTHVHTYKLLHVSMIVAIVAKDKLLLNLQVTTPNLNIPYKNPK